MRDRRQENGIKRTRRRNFIVAAVEVLGIASVFAVGFSAWVVTNDPISVGIGAGLLSANINGKGDKISCIDNLRIISVAFAKGHGFVQSDGTYGNAGQIKGSFSFNVSNAKTVISSMNGQDENKRFSLRIEITASYVTDFTFATPTFSGFSSIVPKATEESSATAGALYNIGLNSSEYVENAISCEFSCSMTFGGTSFPDLATAKYSIVLTPGEYVV